MISQMKNKLLVSACLLWASCSLFGQQQYSELWGSAGELWDPASRLPDFSFAGYHYGEDELPQVPQVATVMDFGAVGDGLHDDSAAFIEAIKAIDAGAIFIPEGRYLIRQIIQIKKSGVVLRGAGADKSVLLFDKTLTELQPNWGATTNGRPTSNYSWSGGLLKISGSYQSQELAQVSSPTPRGSKSLSVDNIEGITVGSRIEIYMQDDAHKSLTKHLYSSQSGDIHNYSGSRASQVVEVCNIAGNQLTLNRPLRFDIELRWKPIIRNFKPTVSESGIEELGFEFPNNPYQGHFTELGFNAIAISGVADCWVRNVKIHNADSGIFVHANFCTLSGIEFSSARQPMLTCTGHHAIILGGRDNLCTDFSFNTKFIHDLGVSANHAGNVFANGSGVDLNFDHHRRAPYENLYSNINVGAGTRVWTCGGGQRLGKHCGARGTFWNIRAEQSLHYPPSNFGPESLNLIGVQSADEEAIEDSGKWFEHPQAKNIQPGELHQSQLQHRLMERSTNARIDRLTGVWAGDIETPNGPLPAVGYFEPDGNGGWTGTADTPTQNAYGIPWSEVSFDGKKLVAKIALTGAVYEATLKGELLEGTWLQNNTAMILNCRRVKTPPLAPLELREQLVGIWEGRLEIGAISLRVGLHLELNHNGGVVGYMTSPDQTSDTYPVGRVDYVSGRKVKIRAGVLATTFEMEISEDGNFIDGKFSQGGQSFEIRMEQVEKATKNIRPQEPQPPFSYQAEEVLYRNEAADIDLAGTLTIPPGKGRFPAVLMITGSGGQDRNEEIFQHKPFWVIADYLSSRGIAVLRVDDRGVGGSTSGSNPGTATSFDFATDVEAGVKFLQSHQQIDSAKIGLMGHSEGGIIAPIVASNNPNIAFVILLAGTGIRGDRLLEIQSEAIQRVSGSAAEEIENALLTQRKLFDLLLDDSLSEAELDRQMRAVISLDPDFIEATKDQQQTGMTQAISQLNNAWMKAFLAHDPAPVLARVSCSVLALCGEVDLQVPHTANLSAIAAALERGGNKDFTIKSFPQLNHLFQHCETGLPSEYGTIEETFSVEVLGVISDWIRARFAG